MKKITEAQTLGRRAGDLRLSIDAEPVSNKAAPVVRHAVFLQIGTTQHRNCIFLTPKQAVRFAARLAGLAQRQQARA